MKQLHAIAGLPRSGSTLLCDLLNQNPRFHASSTSPLSDAVQRLRTFWSTSPEVISELAADKEGAQARLDQALVGLVQGWYQDVDAEVVFDKGRGWISLHEVASVFGMKILCCVRDPRNVLASIEMRRMDHPTLALEGLTNQTQLERTHTYLAREGMIGGPLAFIEDLIRRGSDTVLAIRYEALCADPELTMRALYRDIGEEYFEHDFSSIESTATDLDAQYLYKFPHHRETGPLSESKTDWHEYVPESIATEVIKSFPVYCTTFGYQ